jgi:hypothetical protein
MINSLCTGPQQVLVRLAVVLEVFDDLVKQIDTVSVAVDDIKQSLGELVQKRPELNPLLPPVGSKSQWQDGESGLAVEDANSVVVKWGQRRAEVVIDGQPVYLRRKLGKLMELLLAEDSPAPARDGWKTREELAQRLGVTKHALENIISDLIRELKRQARRGGLVEKNPDLGVWGSVRIALKKYSAAPIQTTFKSLETAK